MFQDNIRDLEHKGVINQPFEFYSEYVHMLQLELQKVQHKIQDAQMIVQAALSDPHQQDGSQLAKLESALEELLNFEMHLAV